MSPISVPVASLVRVPHNHIANQQNGTWDSLQSTIPNSSESREVVSSFSQRIRTHLAVMHQKPTFVLETVDRLSFLQNEIDKLLWPEYVIVPNQEFYERYPVDVSTWVDATYMFRDAINGYWEAKPEDEDRYFVASIWIYFNNTLVSIYWLKNWFENIDRFNLAVEKIQNTINSLFHISEKWIAQEELLAAQDRINALQQQIQDQVKKIELLKVAINNSDQKILIDPLTKIPNREAMNQQIITMLESGIQISWVIILDIDQFKLVNDVHGHQNGDDILVEFANRLGITLERFFDLSRDDRKYGIPGYFPGYSVHRLWGDEYVILLSACDLHTSREFANELIKVITDSDFFISREPTPSDESRIGTLGVTTSIGVSVNNDWLPVDQLLKLADDALYIAKNAWRNRVAIAWDELQLPVNETIIPRKTPGRRKWEVLWDMVTTKKTARFIEKRANNRRWKR